ncbi:FtsX-like permease family protein, partial [Streptomyces sp. NPDC127574]|uniref:FtsX-like permease family protein n=1 Tax=Streptomyces sp. NPDC127574 TaxID=3345401 RepID=UPI003633FA36
PLTLTGVQLDMTQPVDTAQRHQVDLREVNVSDAGGTRRRLALPAGWKADSQTSSTAAAVVAAALAAVGFAVSTAGSLRERRDEFAVLRALGAPRRQLARLIAAEQGVLVGLALVVGVVLGTVLTRAVVPLIVLTSEATRPVPAVLVRLPLPHVAVLLAGVAVTPLAITAFMALRRPDADSSLRRQGGE